MTTRQTPDAMRQAVHKLELQDDYATNKLSNADWRPTRAHYEAARNQVRDVRAILAALDSRAGDAGEGWRLVPVDPTEDMSDAGSRALGGNATQYRDPNGVWSAMLAAATPAPAVDAVPAGEVEPQLNRHDLYRFMDTLKLSEKREVAKAIRFVPAPLTGETDMQRWSRMLAWAAENGKKTELAIAIRAALSHGEGRK